MVNDSRLIQRIRGLAVASLVPFSVRAQERQIQGVFGEKTNLKFVEHGIGKNLDRIATFVSHILLEGRQAV
jgi:hypothetical protein